MGLQNVKELIAKNANVHASNNMGREAIWYAITAGCYHAEFNELANVLLENGANIDSMLVAVAEIQQAKNPFGKKIADFMSSPKIANTLKLHQALNTNDFMAADALLNQPGVENNIIVTFTNHERQTLSRRLSANNSPICQRLAKKLNAIEAKVRGKLDEENANKTVKLIINYILPHYGLIREVLMQGFLPSYDYVALHKGESYDLPAEAVKGVLQEELQSLSYHIQRLMDGNQEEVQQLTLTLNKPAAGSKLMFVPYKLTDIQTFNLQQLIINLQQLNNSLREQLSVSNDSDNVNSPAYIQVGT